MKQTTPASQQRFEEFLQTPLSRLSSGDVMMRIHVRRNTLIAIICSLLAHALFLFLVAPHIQMDNSSAPIPTALEVSFALPIPAQVVQPTPALQPPEKQAPKPIKPKVMTQKLNAHVKPWLSVPKVLDTPTPTTEVEPAQEHAKDAPVDMMAYVNAKRAQRQASEADAAQQNAQAVAREAGPSAEQMREERIKNNFKNGTNGIFEITSLSARHAGFSFRGWTNDYSNARQESFEVEAGIGQDVRLIMIRKMIWLIRQHYQDDFNWDSQRLGRVVSQSARPADNAGLEEFMMMEFFGSNYQKAS